MPVLKRQIRLFWNIKQACGGRYGIQGNAVTRYIEKFSILEYIYRMMIEQTIEVPASRRVFLDLPMELPVGKAKIQFTITPEVVQQREPEKSLKSLFGIDKELDTMDAYFARKQADKTREDVQFKQIRAK